MSKEFVIIQWGRIGDVLLCTPTYRALKKNYPDHKIIVYCVSDSQCEALECNPDIDSVRRLRILKMWRYPYHLYAYLFNRRLVKCHQTTVQRIPLGWSRNKPVKEVVPEMFNPDLKLDVSELQLHFTETEEKRARHALAGYRNVVLMQIHSRSSPNHLWAMEKWAALVSQLPEYTFIQIGLTDEMPVEGVVDWRGKTTLRDALCLLKYANSFVAVDSSLGHASNAVGVRGVVLFGDSSPAHWGHENNINIYKNLPCSPCNYYLHGGPCPYGHECMETITVEEVKQALERQMSSRTSAAPAI
jgi:ADP-heptose:LPS heptosyltransferase